MARNWSEAARAAIDAYPWKNPQDRVRAIADSELVSFGEVVEVDDLPLAVRQFLRRRHAESPKFVWRGEGLKKLVDDFECEILTQALKANGGNLAATARALKTTPRIIAYKVKKLKITTDNQ